jgi:hypothetical protein
MRSAFLLAAAACCTVLTSNVVLAQKPNAKKFGWHTDYAAAKAEARRTGKPIFLVFRCEP